MKDLVLRSVNNEDGDRCVDFIRRPDGRFVYREFRRDVEDRGAWFPISGDRGEVHAGYEEALGAALANVGWLQQAVDRLPPFMP